MAKKCIHKLKRHTYKNDEQVYFCTLSECRYKVNVKLALGKRSICNRCGKEFNLNEVSIRQAKPHCNECTRSRKPEESVVTDTFKLRTASSLRERLEKIKEKPEPVTDTDVLIHAKEDLL